MVVIFPGVLAAAVLCFPELNSGRMWERNGVLSG